jgi:hypothetical protein
MTITCTQKYGLTSSKVSPLAFKASGREMSKLPQCRSRCSNPHTSSATANATVVWSHVTPRSTYLHVGLPYPPLHQRSITFSSAFEALHISRTDRVGDVFCQYQGLDHPPLRRPCCTCQNLHFALNLGFLICATTHSICMEKSGSVARGPPSQLQTITKEESKTTGPQGFLKRG